MSSEPARQYTVICHDGEDAHAVSELVRAENDEVFSTLFPGFTAVLTTEELWTLQGDPRVRLISEVREASIGASLSSLNYQGSQWSLDQLEDAATYSGSVQIEGTGQGVHCYLIDSGIHADLPEFEGRADLVFDAFAAQPGSGNNLDILGHGTATASLVGGKRFGVARKVQLHALRVFYDGGGTTVDIIAALEWIATHGQKPGVVNMSLSGGRDPAEDAALVALTNLGFVICAAAGNHRVDASTISPGGEPAVITCGGYDRFFNIYAGFIGNEGTGYGTVVDILGPAVDMSAQGFTNATGTSFAAPTVAGVICLYKAAFGDHDADTIRRWLVRHGNPDSIIDPLTDCRPPRLTLGGL